MAKQNEKGQGWHGDSDGHAKAGRKGGLARARNLKARKQEQNKDTSNGNDDMPNIF